MARIESIQRKFLRFALRYLPWSDPLRLPAYENRLRLLNMPTLQKHRDYLRFSFIDNLINGRIDCPGLLEKLNLRINAENSTKYYLTNYVLFSSLNDMMVLYNKFGDQLILNDAKNHNFKLYFLFNQN